MSDQLAALATRVAELESQAAFQEELHQQLDQVVARQDRELITLKQQLAALARRMAELQEAGSGDGSDPSSEVPPHY